MSYSYDPIGNRTGVTDALNHTTSYAYDALNRLTTITDALNQTTTFAYDANSNLLSVTDANNHTTSFSYDALNRRSTQTDALNNITTYSYDANGNVTQTKDAKQVTNRYVYDHANRLTGIDLANDGMLDIQYGYDAASRRLTMVDATGTTSYRYDNADQLTTITAPTTGTVSYGYDAAGRRTSLTYPDTHQVSYGYDPQGQLASVTDWLSQTTSYGYDNGERLTSISFPNGVASSLSYNDADGLTTLSYSLNGTPLETLAYGLNAVGDRTSLTDSSGTTSYGYDALDRLTSASYPNGDALSYGYDPVGNRTSLTVNGTTTSNAFNAANELTTSGSDTYSYDNNGNLTSKTVAGVTTTYGYDQLNRLTSITGPTTASYAYNGDGLRVAKAVNGTTTNYSWDPTGLGTVLSDGSDYVWGLGLISQITGGGSATYAQSDGLGSIRLLTDGAGSIVGAEQYDAFGASRSQRGVQLPFGFAGEQYDPESGLVYLRHRYYDPAQGRFLTPDPLGFGGGDVDLYRYGHGNPANLTDPSGLWTLGVCLNGSIGIGWAITGSACLVASSSGEVGVELTGGFVGEAGAVVSASAGPQLSNAERIADLEGPFATAGGSADVGLGGGVDGFIGKNSCGQRIWGGSIQFGVGAADIGAVPGAEAHGGVTTTKTSSVGLPGLLVKGVQSLAQIGHWWP